MLDNTRLKIVNLVDLYMAEVSHYPLLCAQEEKELAVQYEQGRAAKLGFEQAETLDAKSRADLEAAVGRGERARQRLIESNLRLVVALAHRYSGTGIPLNDLLQEGNIGLIEAIERYDHRHGVRLASYAGWWIKRNILLAIPTKWRTICLPLSVNNDLVRLRKARDSLETRLQRPPTPSELAAKLQVSIHRVTMLNRWEQRCLSLEMLVGDHSGVELGDTLPDLNAPPLEEQLMSYQLVEKLQVAMNGLLEPREQVLLSLRFGLNGCELHTYRQVAETWGISPERVRQIQKRALLRLRRAAASYGLGMD